MSDDDRDMGLAATALDAVGRVWNEESDPRELARRIADLVSPWAAYQAPQWKPLPPEVEDEIRDGIRKKLAGANFDGDY